MGRHLTPKDNKHFHTSWRVERLLSKCRKLVDDLLNSAESDDKIAPPTWLERRRLHHARKILLKALKHNETCEPVLSMLGRVHQRLGELEVALSWFEKGANVEGSEVDNVAGAAHCAMAMGKIDKACQLCEEAIERQPYVGKLHVNLGIVQLLGQNVSQARRALAQAFKTNDGESAAVVASVIDRCEQLSLPYPITYLQYIHHLEIVLAEQLERSGE